MIRSMTGFGRGEFAENGMMVSVELKSVNHRYFEWNCRCPRNCAFVDEKLKTLVSKSISRGKVDAFVTINFGDCEKTSIAVNHSFVGPYVEALKEIRDTYGIKNDITLSNIAANAEAFVINKELLGEDVVWSAVESAANAALESFIKMREAEGGRLLQDVKEKTENILGFVSKVEEESPETVKAYRERIEQKMRELLGDVQIEEQRLITETAIFADKVAVDEETVRLRGHITQLNSMLEAGGPVGRKLDFIVQEMNREANTIGSKSQNLKIAHTVVDIKSEIEKIREQIQNIE